MSCNLSVYITTYLALILLFRIIAAAAVFLALKTQLIHTVKHFVNKQPDFFPFRLKHEVERR